MTQDLVEPGSIRVLISKCGLDGHDRGARIVARALKDAGMEVIYGGLHQTPEMVVEAALQEDVDVIGISMHSAAHMTIFPRILRLLADRGLEHILLTGGGVIPPEDAEELRRLGTGRLFGPGASLSDLVSYIRQEMSERRRGGTA